MKIADILNNINKSKDNQEFVCALDFNEEFCYNFGDSDYTQERLKCYWIGYWYCTDSYVGYRAYFFDDKPVAISYQAGRKCEIKYFWVSDEAYNDVRMYLILLDTKNNNNAWKPKLLDLDEDLGDGYHIDFNEQIIGLPKVSYKGAKVTIVDKLGNNCNLSRKIKIQLPNLEEIIVPCSEVDFSFFVNENI